MLNFQRTIPLFLWCTSMFTSISLSQPQIWGVIDGNQGQSEGSPFPNGSLFRTNVNGLDPEFVFAFDTTGIRWPYGQIVLASNGKIYGAVPGGSATIPEPSSYIWEYDPVVDTMQIRIRFYNVPLTENVTEIWSGLTEGAPGVLYGIGRWTTISSPLLSVSLPLYSYNINSDSVQIEATIPGYYYASFGQWYNQYLNSDVTVLPDGRLMLAESRSRVLSGAIGIADTLTDTYEQALTFDQFDAPDGYDPNGDWLEVDGEYYSTTQRGGFAFDDIDLFLENGYGTIYSYNVATNTYTKQHEFTDPLTGFKPFYGMVRGVNGLLYGLAWGGTRANGGSYYPGTIYSFDPQTAEFQHLVDLGLTALGPAVVGAGTGCQLLASSNGRIFGSFWKGLFEYDPEEDTVRYASGLNVGYGRQGASQLLELCRKPNYKQRPTSSYSVCTGSYFAYDLRNVNASSVVWRRNNLVVPSQTNQRLEFATITAADAGVWSCTLTNECGVTEPPHITLTVNAGSGITPVVAGPQVLCGPNGSVELTGNTNGGTWIGGATTSTLTVTQPGQYQIHQPNACGSTFSNILEVERQPVPVAPEIGDADGLVLPLDSISFCPEYPYPLFGNGPGVWHDVPVGTWHTPAGDADDGSNAPSITADMYGVYYITLSNACGTDTSLQIRAVPPAPWPPPNISVTDQFGEQVDLLLCSGDSVTVTVNYPDPIYTLYNDELGYVASGSAFVLGDTAHYYLTALGPCQGQGSDTLRFQLQVDEFLPPPAVILPDDGSPLIGCDQDSMYLTSQYPHAIWSWMDADGNPQVDTTAQLLVDWNISGNGFYTLVNYNGCGESANDGIQVQGITAPEVAYSEPTDSLCLNAPTFLLAPGTPVNGTYGGPGVTGNTFDPVVAGAGEHTITYSYSNGTCTGYAQDVITVDICASIEQLSTDIGQWIRISPNPNNGQFTLEVTHNFTKGSVTVYDAQGRRVLRPKRIAPGPNALELDVRSGVYTVRIEIDGEVEQHSVVVTKE